MTMLNEFPWIYGMRSGPYIKIGAANDVEKRLKQFQLGNPHKITVAFRKMCDEAYWVEARMHQILKPKKHRREWFEIDLAGARAALAQALEDLAEKRRKQISWEMQTGEWEDGPHPHASWNGRGISPPHPLTNWNR